MNATVLKGPSWGPASKAKPQQLVVLLHGYGASGNQVIGMASRLSKVLPDAVFHAPGGQEPSGHGPGRRWFPLENLDAVSVADGVRRAALALDGFIDSQLQRYDLPDTAYALAGFSQGAMTALFTGLRRAAAPRAIVAYAGALLDPTSLTAELRNQAPVLLAHGEQDDVVPVTRSRDAEVSLRSRGVPVESIYTPKLGHVVGAEGTAAAIDFIRRGFGL